jgi:hypothetical protein
MSNDYLEFLGDFEAICETALVSESGPQGVLIDEKTEGRKSRDTAPLKTSAVGIQAAAVLQRPKEASPTILKNLILHLNSATFSATFLLN